MPLDQRVEEGLIAGNVDRNRPGAVAVVEQVLVAGLVVAAVEVRIPPAGGHANLRIGGFDIEVEGSGHHPIPHVLRELGEALGAGRVEVVALQAEAILAGPAHRLAEFVLPEDFELGTGVAAVDPLLLQEVEADRGVAVAGEQDVPLDQRIEEGLVAGDVDRDRPGAVAVVGQVLVAGLVVAAVEVRIPPAGGHAHLRIAGSDVQIEGLGHHPVPNVLRNLREALRTGRVEVVALQAEAVVAAPGDRLSELVLPEEALDDFHVASVAFHPDVLQDVELERSIAAAREEEMLGVHGVG